MGLHCSLSGSAVGCRTVSRDDGVCHLTLLWWSRGVGRAPFLSAADGGHARTPGLLLQQGDSARLGTRVLCSSIMQHKEEESYACGVDHELPRSCKLLRYSAGEAEDDAPFGTANGKPRQTGRPACSRHVVAIGCPRGWYAVLSNAVVMVADGCRARRRSLGLTTTPPVAKRRRTGPFCLARRPPTPSRLRFDPF